MQLTNLNVNNIKYYAYEIATKLLFRIETADRMKSNIHRKERQNCDQFELQLKSKMKQISEHNVVTHMAVGQFSGMLAAASSHVSAKVFNTQYSVDQR